MKLKNTKTEENLRAALAGESIARNKYTYFADFAKKMGEPEIAKVFEQLAVNEMTHARLWYELLNGKPESVESCIRQAASGEYDEWHSMYPEFAKQARVDGLNDIAVMFEHVANIEKSHENRFVTLLAKLQAKELKEVEKQKTAPNVKVKKEGYRCQFCGAIFDHCPDVCDVCEAIGAFDRVEYYE